MSLLVLVRHGQARFGAGDYDALSYLGIRQCEALREYWHGRSETFDEVWSGSLRRQVHSAQTAARDPQVDARWNEYDADATLRCLAPQIASASPEFQALWDAHRAGPTDQKRFQRMFEPLMLAWVNGTVEHPEVEPWPAFRDRVRAALRELVERPGSRRVAVFTSGGPVGVAVMTALGAADRRALELNWRTRNASVTNFLFSSGRISLDGYNATPHLAAAMESFR